MNLQALTGATQSIVSALFPERQETLPLGATVCQEVSTGLQWYHNLMQARQGRVGYVGTRAIGLLYQHCSCQDKSAQRHP